MDRQKKFAFLFRIHNAKKQETREKRIHSL
ncbi:YdeI/OmpD-associated family protein [Paenibacillus glacialis]|nr:YdeI/OmpD-associated family protein [Paenibacillus glacialis]